MSTAEEREEETFYGSTDHHARQFTLNTCTENSTDVVHVHVVASHFEEFLLERHGSVGVTKQKNDDLVAATTDLNAKGEIVGWVCDQGSQLSLELVELG